jgi:hypothetical protein
MSINEIVPEVEYSTKQVAELIGLSSRQVGRLVDAGQFPGSWRKSTLPKSERVIPGTAVIEFLQKRQQS